MKQVTQSDTTEVRAGSSSGKELPLAGTTAVEDTTNLRRSSATGVPEKAGMPASGDTSNVGTASGSARPSQGPSAKQLSVEPSYRVVLRSLLYPGWGQLYNKKYLKALAVFSSEATLLGMIYNESREASEAYDAHLAASDLATSERLYAEYEKHFNRRDSLIWWSAGLVLFSLADAYVDAHLLTFEEEFGESRGRGNVSIAATGRRNGGFVELRYAF